MDSIRKRIGSKTNNNFVLVEKRSCRILARSLVKIPIDSLWGNDDDDGDDCPFWGGGEGGGVAVVVLLKFVVLIIGLLGGRRGGEEEAG